ncbi:unnamed protein product [Bursaphelenchus okinawaensis]|uniref:G-protein coupled receptors family 1 profile domain-containing protein n=1 Tax=Bursaphelenchus okinawaensis TaxID=465554 RepID=A0A811KJB7_9BILA|nr:unnamed protein product [Bursaphelenchus okinawaensis]CAG9104871.1 unnamed protein product [Bursaphelenchus okinawaensis]
MDEPDYGFELQPTVYPPDCSTVNNTAFTNIDFLHSYNIISWPNFTNCLPNCGMCTNFASDQVYLIYNFLIIGFILPFISFCGLFGNGFSAFVYSRPAMRTSTNLYLCALGCSDNAVIITALFLFFLDSIRKYSLQLTIIYNVLSPYIYPAGMIAQTCSVYFTLVAAIDCFAQVCLPESCKKLMSRPKTVTILLCSVVVFSIAYNLPHCFESVLIECWHNQFNAASIEVCPAPFRFHETYTLVYYKYMYSIFLAIGPLILLIILNTCIILSTMVFKTADCDPSDNVALILVVLLFISCNVIALLINVFEANLSNLLEWRINYIIDISNLLVVFNSSFNFVIYYRFSKVFRRNFKLNIMGRCFGKKTVMFTNYNTPNQNLMAKMEPSGQTVSTYRYPQDESCNSLDQKLKAAANTEVLI